MSHAPLTNWTMPTLQAMADAAQDHADGGGGLALALAGVDDERGPVLSVLVAMILSRALPCRAIFSWCSRLRASSCASVMMPALRSRGDGADHGRCCAAAATVRVVRLPASARSSPQASGLLVFEKSAYASSPI